MRRNMLALGLLAATAAASALVGSTRAHSSPTLTPALVQDVKTGSDTLTGSTSGGSDPIASHGHSKADARRIKELIENAQAEFARRPQTAE